MAIKVNKFMPLNWHYLKECDPLPIGQSTFITGINTSGKSTMIDAMRFLFFVTTSQFNKANALAGDRQSRPLVSYVRGAIDITAELSEDDAPGRYLREGATVTHVVAELLDEDADVYTVIGVSVFAPPIEEMSQLKPVWWIASNCRLEELQFIIRAENGGRRFATLEEVQKLTPAGERILTCANQRQAKMRFSILFGLTDSRIGDEKALEAWAKTQDNAIAFNPKGMKNLDQFIKDLVLPKQEIRTEEFKKLLETHQQLQKTSGELNQQCQRLKAVVDDCEQYHEKSAQKLRLSMITSLAQAELLEKQIEEQQALCDQLDDVVRTQKKKKNEISIVRDTLTKTLAELQASESNEALKRLEQLQKDCDSEILACRENAGHLAEILALVKKYAEQVNSLFGSSVIDIAPLLKYDEPHKLREPDIALFPTLEDDLNRAQSIVEDMLWKTISVKEDKNRKLQALKEEINELERGLSYTDNKSATILKKAIAAEFKTQGILDEPKFLCELLEFTDPSWAPAAEAFMGGYRFSVVVMPNNFLIAANAYKKLCAENPNIYGVTLVDSTAFRHDDSIPAAFSMASLFISQNPYARAYINYSYNQVVLVDDAANPPSKDGTYISKEGMRYARRGFSRMRPVRLVIGSEARRLRLEECHAETTEAERGYRLAAQQELQCRKVKQLQQERYMNEFFANGRRLLIDSAQLPLLQEKKSALERDLEKLRSASAQQKIKRVEGDLSRAQKTLQEAEGALVQSMSDLKIAGHACTEMQTNLSGCEEDISTWQQDYPSEFEAAGEELRARKDISRKGVKGFRESLGDEMGQLKADMDELNFRIKQYQVNYNTEFGTGYGEQGYESMAEFRESYNMLSSSQIPEIKAKADKAALQTRLCFEDDIMNSLRTAIGDADRMLGSINRYMERMEYNGCIYKFARVEPADGRREEYEMIRSKHNEATNDGQSSLDSLSFEDAYAARRAQLFAAIEKGEETKNGLDLLDYRTYCKFGVTVSIPGDPDRSGKLSNIILSGSGAEVQVPCYIILTAALVQKYNRANRLRGDINTSKALRIIMIDECFDKMDANNVKNMIDFISHDMGLQLIASAPTDKFSVVGINTDSILFMKGDKNLRQRDCYAFTAPAFSRIIADVLEAEGVEREAGAI